MARDAATWRCLREHREFGEVRTSGLCPRATFLEAHTKNRQPDLLNQRVSSDWANPAFYDDAVRNRRRGLLASLRVPLEDRCRSPLPQSPLERSM